MSSQVTQNILPLAFGVHHAPLDAPRKLVVMCLQFENEAITKALCVSLKAAKRKQAYVAALIGKHESYISMLKTGKRRITEELIQPLCAATGSNLIRQVWEAVAAMDTDDEARCIERIAHALPVAA